MMKNILFLVLLGISSLSITACAEKADTASVPNFEGAWQSTTDKTYTLMISGEKWLETSGGQPMPASTFEYQAQCSLGDTKDPCLLVKGEFDVELYYIGEHDKKTLELLPEGRAPLHFTRVDG